MTRVAMGIDASLTGTGLVAAPFDWGLDWSRIARAKFGLGLPKDAPEVDRLRRIDWIARQTAEFARRHGVTDIFMEQYAFAKKVGQAHALGELGGSIKRDLMLGLGLPLTVVGANTARALLGTFSAHGKKGLPKPPPVKDQVHAALRRAGLPACWDGDETDAWVVANWGLSGVSGATALILREAA